MQVNLRWTISHPGRFNFLHLLSPMETCLSWLGKGFNFNFFVGNQETGNNASPVDQERNRGGSIELQTQNGGAGSEPLRQNGGVGSQLLTQNGEQGDAEV